MLSGCQLGTDISLLILIKSVLLYAACDPNLRLAKMDQNCPGAQQERLFQKGAFCF